MTPAVLVKNLSFSYQKRLILNNVSWSVLPGETVVLTGDSGCGKTTLCNILCGIIPNAVHGKQAGEVLLFGESIKGAPLYQTAQKIGMVFQNADQQLIAATVEDELAFAPENLCLPPETIRAQVDQMLSRFFLTAYRRTNPAKLSGGQKKLVTIAATLMLNPPILILDEPMTGLDDAGRALVSDTIGALHQDGVTLIVVEHDPKLYPKGAAVYHMEEGTL